MAWQKRFKEDPIFAAALRAKWRISGSKNSRTEKAVKARIDLAKKRRGTKISDEQKVKISSSMTGRNRGKQNSQFGTCWINNGLEDKKIKKIDVKDWLEIGWHPGRRKMKPFSEERRLRMSEAGKSRWAYEKIHGIKRDYSKR